MSERGKSDVDKSNVTKSSPLPYTDLLLFSFILQVVLAPPLYRDRPYWYRQQMPEVATQISAMFSASPPPNFHLLPSFINQSYTDGINLTPVAGLHYVLFLFDKTEVVLADAAASTEDQVGLV